MKIIDAYEEAFSAFPNGTFDLSSWRSWNFHRSKNKWPY